MEDASKCEYDNNHRAMVRISVALLEIQNNAKELRAFILDEKRQIILDKNNRKSQFINQLKS